jgi:hypothetical protein
MLDGQRLVNCLRIAIRKEFGDEGMLRIKNRSLDILAESAPEDIRDEALKTVEAIKKLNK